jgi:hypothetical protein
VARAERRSRRICCAGLFFADAVQGKPGILVLECCRCGQQWLRHPDGALAFRRYGEPSQKIEPPGPGRSEIKCY